MRLNPLHLRIGLLVLNLVAAVGVPAYAVLSYREMAGDVAPLDLADPGDLVFREGEAAAARGPAGHMWEGFLPVPPPTAPPDEPAGISVPAPPHDPAKLQPGPLAAEPHNLEYVFSIIRRDNPRGNFVILRRRAAPAPGGSRSGAALSRSVAVTQRPPRVTVGGRRAVREHPHDTISFFVRERRYTDRKQGLDFMIHSAGEVDLVYWIPGEPGKMYALPKVGQDGRHREMGLEEPDSPGDPGDPGDEEERRLERIIYHDRKDIESGIEEEYRKMLEGEPAGPLLSPGGGP